MVTKKVLVSYSPDIIVPEFKKNLPHEVPYFRFPGLSCYGDLAHAVFTRHGGVSQSPFYSLNMSRSAGDSKEKVKCNLQIVKAAIGARSLEFTNQVHGKNVVVLRQNDSVVSEKQVQADAMKKRMYI